MSTKIQCGDKSFKNAIRYLADDVFAYYYVTQNKWLSKTF